MVNFNEVRKYLIDNMAEFGNISFTAQDETNGNSFSSIYLIEKPKNHKITSGNALIIKFHELGGGNHVRKYFVEIWLLSKDLTDIVTIKDKLVDLLDFYKAPCQIPNINKFRLDSESGITFDESTQMYVNRIYFDCNKF